MPMSRYISTLGAVFSSVTLFSAALPADELSVVELSTPELSTLELSTPGHPTISILRSAVEAEESDQLTPDNESTDQTNPAGPSDSNVEQPTPIAPGSETSQPIDPGVEAPVTPGQPQTAPEPTAVNTTNQYNRIIATAACDPGAMDVRIIESVQDLADINNPDIRIFCIKPGDYRAAGTVNLSSSGSADKPRILRQLADWPETLTNTVQQAPDARTVVSKIRLSNASHWVIDGISVINEDSATSLANRSIEMVNESSNNVVHRSLVEGGRVAIRIHGSHRNLLQNNVVRNTVLTDGDSNCINIEGDPGQTVSGNQVVGNEVYDCTDSLQLVTLAASKGNLTFPGTLVANNDFYLTSAMYTDCAGNSDPAGNCSRAEGRFDIKGGGTGPSDDQSIRVIGNRIWGARATDPTLGGTSWGGGINICCGRDVSYVTIKDNIIMSNDRGINIGGDNTHSINISGNILYDIGSDNSHSGHAMLDLDTTHSHTWTNNVVVDSKIWGMFLGHQQTVSCNTVINSWRSVTSNDTVMGGNYYFGEVQVPNNTSGKTDILMSTAESSANTPLCVFRKQLTGPEQICIPYAQQTVGSPHQGACTDQ